MLGTVEPAVRALEYAMEQAAVDRDWGNVIKAAAHLLDRAGFGPTSKIVVEDDQRDLTELSTDELGARMEKLLLAIRAQQNEAKVDAGPFPATTH